MKIREEYIAAAINNWNAKSSEEQAIFMTFLFDEQPNLGGQLSGLMIQEGIPIDLVQYGIDIACIVLDSVKRAGCKLPLLTHEMFFSELREIQAFFSLLETEGDWVKDAQLETFKEKAILAFAMVELKDIHLEQKHPKGYLISVVVLTLVNLVEKNLRK